MHWLKLENRKLWILLAFLLLWIGSPFFNFVVPVHDGFNFTYGFDIAVDDNQLTISQLISGSQTDLAGIQVGDRLISINGVVLSQEIQGKKWQLNQRSQFLSFVREVISQYFHYNQRVYLEVERQGHRYPVSFILLRPGLSENIKLLITNQTWLVGFILWSIGMFMYWKYSHDHFIQIFFLICITGYGSLTFAGYSIFQIYSLTVFKMITTGLLIILNSCLFFHFFNIFPLYRNLGKFPRPSLAYVLSLGALLWGSHAFTLINPSDLETLFHTLRNYYAFLLYLAGLGLYAYQYFTQKEPLIRRQLQFIFFGLVFGMVPWIIFYAIPVLILDRQQQIADPSNWFILIAAFPAAFSLSAIGNNLFEIDKMIKRSTVLFLTGICLVAVYLTVVALISFPFVLDIGSYTYELFAAFAVAAAIHPLYKKVQDIVELRLYRVEYDYKQSIFEFARTVSSQIHLEKLLQTLLHQLSRWLGISRGVVYLQIVEESNYFNPEEVLGLSREEKMAMPAIHKMDPLMGFLSRGVFSPVGSMESDNTTFRQLREKGIVLLIPFFTKEKCIGFLALGKKITDLEFDTEDLQLLSILSNQTALAIENAIAFRTLAQLNLTLEEKVREQTAELRNAVENLKFTQQQLINAEKMASLGRLISGIAHEINNPLTIISLNVENFSTYREMLKTLSAILERIDSTNPLRKRWDEFKDKSNWESQLGHLDRIIDSSTAGVERIKKIVIDLSKFSIIDKSEYRPVNLNDILNHCLEAFQPALPNRITLHRTKGEIPPIEGLASQLEQAFTNLIQNAIEAIPGSGGIWIETRSENQRIYVSIRDNGRGISPEIEPRIFDPFFTTKENVPDSGLGLSLVSSIVKKHRGKIEFQTKPGEGTTFILSFPHQAWEPNSEKPADRFSNVEIFK